MPQKRTLEFPASRKAVVTFAETVMQPKEEAEHPRNLSEKCLNPHLARVVGVVLLRLTNI